LAHKGKSKLILRVAGLGLNLRFDGKRRGIQRAISTRPKEGAMWLIRFEVAKITEAAAAKTATSSAATSAPPSAEAAATPSKTSSSSKTTAAARTSSGSTTLSAATSLAARASPA
jgi:hypothetical protein